MKSRLCLLSAVSLLHLQVVASARPEPAARVVPGGAAAESVIAISINENGRPVPGALFDIARSSAADPSGQTITITKIDGETEVPLAPPKRVVAPDGNGDGLANAINVFPQEALETDTHYRITFSAVAGRPVFAYSAGGGNFTVDQTTTLDAGEIDAEDIPIRDTAALKSSIALGGGDEGSLLSLKARYGKLTREDNSFGMINANLEADLSFGDDTESLVYGRVLGEIDALTKVPFKRGGYFEGSAFYGLDGKIESDQDFDNWDASAGLAGWWFVTCQALEDFGKGLRITKDDNVAVHPLSFKLDASYVYASEREDPAADPEDIRLNARLIWLNRIYSDATVPLMDSRFDINLLVDAGAAWEPDGGDFHPTYRVGLEFAPVEFENRNLAFSLMYAKGEFSPTFVDEDAFLAALKYNF